MTLVGEYLGAVLATAKRDAMIFVSYRFRIVTQFLTMLLTLTMFYYISKLIRPDAVGSHAHYFSFAVVGVVSMAVLTSALNIADIVRMELMQGTFERILISPLGPVGGVISVALFPIAYSTFLAGTMLALAVAFYGVSVDPAAIPAALAVGALGALALSCIGLIFVACLLAFKSATGVTWIIAGLSLFAGVYFPVKLIPQWLQWVPQVQPLTPALDLFRHLLVRTRAIEPVWLELVKLCGFAVVLMPASFALLWLAVHVSRRRGTIMEF